MEYLKEPWVLWMIFAAALIIGEIFISGFFILFFGVGAIPAAIVAKLHGPFYLQLLVFAVTSGVLLAFCRKIALKLTAGSPNNIGSDRMIGKDAYVLKEINVKTASGLVRVEREEWRAESESGETIPVERWAEVIRIDGTRLIVREKKDKLGGN
jgi:membrane protein implicated in regulation of membrane protease activity